MACAGRAYGSGGVGIDDTPLSASRTVYRVAWDGDKWWLEATPRAKYPWVLYNRDGVRQEIGSPEVGAAQGVAEVWLDVRGVEDER